MEPAPSDRTLAGHVESVSARAASDTERLTAALLERCWPGGNGDRTESCAREWLRRWGPRGAGASPPACNCVEGRCGVCN
ncbi:MAG TPA: hypothetical protein VMD79_07560 [Solirubrobacteraceae bacterium]|nr:hypothetical protein [Solirubrobacteraceae bacterium]